jgi:perosamine synthetase
MIPVNEPALDARDLELVSDCVRSGWVSSAGKYIDAFERGWAEYCGRKHGIAVSNGTTALQVAARCAGLGPGDEVIMPTFTIVSCALAVVETGATPVLVDSDPRTWCMDVEQVAAKITSRTKAIMPVHIYGHPVDMDPLMDLADKHGLAIIEDAAEAHGAEYLSGRDGPGATWRRCGGFGALSTFSFYANKLITTGEGGMILTDDATLAEKARRARNLAFVPERRFLHRELGYNYRLTNVQAAMGVAQLERFPSIVERKRAMARRYNEGLCRIRDVQLPAQESWARSVYWMYGLVLGDSHEFDAVEGARRLKAAGVETRPFFLGMHSQPVFRERGLFKNEEYPVADRIAERGFYLPSGLALTEGQIDSVIAAVRKVLA